MEKRDEYSVVQDDDHQDDSRQRQFPNRTEMIEYCAANQSNEIAGKQVNLDFQGDVAPTNGIETLPQNAKRIQKKCLKADNTQKRHARKPFIGQHEAYDFRSGKSQQEQRRK